MTGIAHDGPVARLGPWQQPVPNDAFDLRMRAPCAPLTRGMRRLVMAAVVAATAISLRFLLLGAWPVLLFSILDMGALAVALYLSRRRQVPEERLRIGRGQVELIRRDGNDRENRVCLPVSWTRLEVTQRPFGDCELWLTHRQERHPLGLTISAAERRSLAPRIAAALGAARS